MPISLNRWENTAQDREFRNKTNQNWDNIEKTHNYIEEISEEAINTANAANEKANKANELSNNVKTQLDTVIIEGDSSVEAAQARLDTTGKVHPNLKARLDSDFNKQDPSKKVNKAGDTMTGRLTIKVPDNSDPLVLENANGRIRYIPAPDANYIQSGTLANLARKLVISGYNATTIDEVYVQANKFNVHGDAYVKGKQVATTTDVRQWTDQTDYKVGKGNKDANGIFTLLEYRRQDNTLVAKSVLSGGTSPQYTTRTITYYNTTGTAVEKTTVRTLSYDNDGDLVSEV
jgi:hypothetical protein